MYDVSSSPTQLADDIKSFMQKISAKADQELLTHYPSAWPARSVVQTVSGTRDRSVIVVPGDPTQPFDERQV
jgi:2-methylcitrate dehydratase PrpD